MMSLQMNGLFSKIILGVGLLGAIFSSGPLKVNIYVDAIMEPESNDVNISAILDSFQIGYNKILRPNYGELPVTVGVSLYVLSVSDVSEVQMEFTVDMYFRQFWNDPRLAFERRPGFSRLVLGSEYANQIWVPDTFFVNEKTSSIDSNNQFLRISNPGDILRSMKMSITASCPMNLKYFPMDSQLCQLEIESFGHTMSDIRYRWNDGDMSVQLAPDVSLPQFQILGHRQKTIEASLSSGNYSRLVMVMQFERSMVYYLLQFYIPSSLIVMLSWVSFWIDRRAITARMSHGAISVLTMIIILSSASSVHPKVSYVKALDVYLVVCFFFVIASLLECMSLGCTALKVQKRNQDNIDLEDSASTADNTSNSNIDNICRIFFPLAFACFQLTYWIFMYYENINNNVDDLVLL